jgi:hypothetical protein
MPQQLVEPPLPPEQPAPPAPPTPSEGVTFIVGSLVKHRANNQQGVVVWTASEYERLRGHSHPLEKPQLMVSFGPGNTVDCYAAELEPVTTP